MPRHTSFAHEDPFELAKRIPVGSRFTRNDKRGYWFARTPFGPGLKSRRVYVGSEANKAHVERAWAIVGAELAKLEATPEGRQLRALGVLATAPKLARTQILEGAERASRISAQGAFSFAAAGRAGRRRPKE